VGAYFDNRVKLDSSKKRPRMPTKPELLCSRPPPAAAAGAHGLEGHVHATGRLPGPSGQPAVTILHFESLGAAIHSPALDLHVPAPFTSGARLLRRVWAICNCADAGPARVQGVSHQIHQKDTLANCCFVHYFPLEYFTLFFETTIILLSNYCFGNRKGLLDHIQPKKYF